MWMPWSVLSCFGLAVVSALLPWVNGELVLLAFAASAPDMPHLLALVIAATAGQVVGKSTMFLLARHAAARTGASLVGPEDDAQGGVAHGTEGTPRPSTTARRTLERWRAYGRRSPRALTGLLLVSATVGLPPFYLLAVVAGGLGVGFTRFVTVAVIGRFLHFGGIALVPALFKSVWQ